MDDDDRAFREMRLDALPPSPAAAVSELRDYDWQSPEAREAYDTIKDLLGREVLDQRFAGMKQALENATDEDRAAVSEMLTDLNELLAKHRVGTDTPEDFDAFIAKPSNFFPENPRTVDELIDALAQRSAAAQRMLNSMTAAQREELMQLSAQAFGSPELMGQLSQLDANLQSLRPGEDLVQAPRASAATSRPGWARVPASCRSWASWTGWPSSWARRTRAPGSTTSTWTRCAATSDGTPPSRPARSPSWRRRCAIRGCFGAAPTAQLRLSPAAMRRLGQSLLKDAATRLSAPRAPATPGWRARAARSPARPGSGSSATPSPGTSPVPSPTRCCARRPRAGARGSRRGRRPEGRG